MQRRSPYIRAAGRESGVAILTVLLVLLALLVLTAPFLMTARNASRASSQAADRVQVRIALDSAGRHARAQLGRSHPSVDSTPYFDDEEELGLDTELEPSFLDAHDTGGVMWDVRVRDVAGSIDLNSAPPQLFANLLGASTRLTQPIDAEGDELLVSSTHGFPDVGFLWVGRELIGYTGKTIRSFTGLQRGLASYEDEEGNALECGPQPSGGHEPGTVVLDQRAFAPVLWRVFTSDGRPRRFDAPEQVRDSAQLALGGLDEAALEAFATHGTVYGGVRGGRRFQRAARLTEPIQGGVDCYFECDAQRFFNAGSTIQITDGQTTELAVVQERTGEGMIVFEPFVNDYEAFTAEVRVLARRPVNINLASAETLQLLLENLQHSGKNERVTRGEAKELTALILESRPFDGLEDFLRRVVLPAAGLETLPAGAPVHPDAVADGGTLIDSWDALAVYANALNANDARLAYSTMPFSFTTRDVYDLDLRATVNAPSGVERVTSRRNQVELVVPQAELMQLWARQEDFDEAIRLDREAPYWATGPDATSRWDGNNTPPTRFIAHIGTHDGRIFIPGISKVPEEWGADTPPVPEHVFASREETGWAMPMPSRVRETSRLAGHVLHFDHETRDPEGRYLPDETVTESTDDEMLGWTDPAEPLLTCLDLSLWIKPQDLGPGTLVDVGADSLDSDRVTLSIEGPDLVLRVLDAVGDHPDTADEEAAEARFELAGGLGPGLAPDTWTHVAIDVQGTRPDQISMLVDGQAFGVRQPGLTRVTSSVAETSSTISIENAEGWPDVGLARIGREWIEFVRSGTVLNCLHNVSGPNAGFGGRFARVPFVGVDEQAVGEPVYVAELDGFYNPGTPIEVAGYSIPLTSDAPSGSSQLSTNLGRFAVARVAEVIGGKGTFGDPLTEVHLGLDMGSGFDGNSGMTALGIEPADQNMSPQTVMAAFSDTGGYAALVQWMPSSWTYGGVRVDAPNFETTTGYPMFGVEIVQYTKDVANDALNIVRRAALRGIDQKPHAFVTNWNFFWNVNGQTFSFNDDIEVDVFVVPISIHVPGSYGLNGFLVSPPDSSDFAQITYPDTNVEWTEWVRYDTITPENHLVRNGAEGLDDLFQALTHGPGGDFSSVPNPNPPPPPPPGGGGGGGVKPKKPSAVSAAAQPPAAASQSTKGPTYWQPYLGAPDPDEETWPITRAARSQFQFRGVFGTYQRDHPVGTLVLPVWRVQTHDETNGDWFSGQPGAHDPILVMDEDPTALGWPGVVHRAYRPLQYTVYSWSHVGGDVTQAQGSGPGAAFEDGYLQSDTHLALKEALAAPVVWTPVQTRTELAETRTRSRILKHPTGERPRIVDRAVVGGTLRGSEVPAMVVDEVAFGSTVFGEQSDVGPPGEGGQLVLVEALQDGGTEFDVQPRQLRLALGLEYDDTDVLNWLPEDAGLLRLGEEIVCYDTRDAISGHIELASGGRGLLGTFEQSHPLGSSAAYLEAWPVSTLTAGIDAADDFLPLEDLVGFPSQGTVLIDDELIHYTRRREGGLEMPRGSEVPGAMDRKGGGIFRGRYGTVPAGHAAGTPVILFPFRYWDRQAERVDGPELSYFGLSVDQPNAFFRSLFWQADAVDGSDLYVLQRASDPGHDEPVPWDADPDTTEGLTRYEVGMPAGDVNPIGVQSDRMEWRVFTRFRPGAFDAVGGLSHGWKRVPRLRLFGVEYLGPNQVLRRVDG